MTQVQINGQVVFTGSADDARAYAATAARRVVDRYPTDDRQQIQVSRMVINWMERGVISGVRPYLINDEHPAIPEDWGKRIEAPRVLIVVEGDDA